MGELMCGRSLGDAVAAENSITVGSAAGYGCPTECVGAGDRCRFWGAALGRNSSTARGSRTPLAIAPTRCAAGAGALGLALANLAG